MGQHVIVVDSGVWMKVCVETNTVLRYVNLVSYCFNIRVE